MKLNYALLSVMAVSSFVVLIQISYSQQKSGDEFSVGYVTKTEYNELDWEEFRREKRNTIKKGVIDGFLSVKETSPGNYDIYLYESLEAREYDRPRRSIQIGSDIFRGGLSSEMLEKKYTVLDKKWVGIYGIFEIIGKENNWLLLSNTVRCHSVEWRNKKGELVRTLE